MAVNVSDDDALIDALITAGLIVGMASRLKTEEWIKLAQMKDLEQEHVDNILLIAGLRRNLFAGNVKKP
jgi:hypothetical protein